MTLERHRRPGAAARETTRLTAGRAAAVLLLVTGGAASAQTQPQPRMQSQTQTQTPAQTQAQTQAQAQAQTQAPAPAVVLSGRMGDRALLVVGGRPRALAVGETAAGVRLLRWVGDEAEVEHGGLRQRLAVGATPVLLSAVAAPTGAREVVITAGPGGHFTSGGSINGRPVQFMVDTGATLISIGRDDALRLGIDLASARRGLSGTANGTIEIRLVTLNSVRVGDVELAQVGAAVLPQNLPVVLLGNSFLSRLQMRRDNDVMRLQLK